MGTPKRICGPDLTYHLTSRCINSAKMMKLDKMKELLLSVLNMALAKYSFELSNYCIMDNHFHFFIRTLDDSPTISRIMQFIKAQYARRYNKIMKRTGPFWNERFKDTIIEKTEDPENTYHHINSYIINNPVKAKYVSDAKDYKYGCVHFYLDEKYVPPVKLTFHKYFLKLGNTFHERMVRFLEFEEIYKMKLSTDTAL